MKQIILALSLVFIGCGKTMDSRYDESAGPQGSQGPAGQNGATGPQGVSGANGIGCTIQQTTTGAKITCADGSTAELTNGKNGTNGTNGTNSSCGDDDKDNH
jgi:hypothetical protein